MIHAIASIKVKQNATDEFIDIFKSDVPNVLQEKVCLGYEPAKDFPTVLPIQETDPAIIEREIRLDSRIRISQLYRSVQLLVVGSFLWEFI